MKLLISAAIGGMLLWHTGQLPNVKIGFENAMTLNEVLAKALQVASK